MNKTPTTLIIMDGFGLRSEASGNAIRTAATPRLDQFFQDFAHTELSASGLDVGLPAGQMGNSEVGHTNIGAGRVVFQDLPRITKSIADGDFFQNPAYLHAMDQCLQNDTSLHLMGLLSDGGVHSHLDHLFALLRMAKDKGLTKVFIHAFLDGRDVSPTSGADFVARTVEACREIGVGRIATVMGRYYAMDRDKRWDRVEQAYDAMVYGEGATFNPVPVAAVKDSYAAGITDEFVEPVVCDSEGTISDNDSVIFFNFRPDRAREITRALVDPNFDGFTRQFFPLTFVCNTEYDATMPNVEVAFPRTSVRNGLGEYLSQMGMTQLRIAETEKYAHVTFFFNGGSETVFPGEDRVLVASPKVATYDLQPEMSAHEVADKCVERIESGAYDVIILNFANCDMVGHTGVFDAAVKAVETVDACVGQVVDATLKMGGIAMITADHGNAEQMTEPDGSPMTAHTTNPVPFILCGAGTELRSGGRLADIAPTILDVMGLACPPEMDGKTLIVK
ncbi:MAG: 2,3-bisphosphoglycerate-independent phosphoglycerate mutase [Dysosmobacter sp.]